MTKEDLITIELTRKEAKELLYAIWHERNDLRGGLPYATEVVKNRVVGGIKALTSVEKKINAKGVK